MFFRGAGYEYDRSGSIVGKSKELVVSRITRARLNQASGDEYTMADDAENAAHAYVKALGFYLLERETSRETIESMVKSVETSSEQAGIDIWGFDYAKRIKRSLEREGCGDMLA